MAKKQANQPDKAAAKAPAAAASTAAPAAPAVSAAVDPAAYVAPVTADAATQGETFGDDVIADDGLDGHSEAEAQTLERLLDGGDDAALAAVLGGEPIETVTRELVDGGGGRTGEVQFTIPVDPALGAISLATLPTMAADVRLHLQAYLGCLFTLDEGKCITADGRIFTLAMNKAGDALEARLP
jgi:hypothetical protein